MAEHNAAPSLQDQGEKKTEHSHGHGHSHDHADGDHKSEIVAIGTLTLGGATFAIDREGQVESGKETTFGVELISGAAVVPTAGWLANPDGAKVSEEVSGEGHDQHWHFTVDPLMPVKKSQFVLRVGEEQGAIDFAHGAEPCNDGILTVLKSANAPEWRGFLELKLHGDAGDLEIWLYQRTGSKLWMSTSGKPSPFDVPKETVIGLTFPSHPGKTVEMRVRDMEKNEDEEGTPNMRGDGTNYFIFPGESGADPSWLVGEKWRGVAIVSFQVGGNTFSCDPFILVPHDAL
jgi:hypothetical protein